MSEQRTYPSGVPCWVDVLAPDLDAAAAFYRGLFGWDLEDAMPPGAPGSYLIARLDGADVAAIGPGDEARWQTYVAVDSADDAAAQVVSLGGAVVTEPADAGPGGRTAACVDPAGASFHLWQARRRLGAQVSNLPGAWNFSDLHTPDPVAAQPFYAALFGWEVDELSYGPGEPARLVRRPGYGDHLAATVDPGIHDRQAAISAPPGFADGVAWIARTAAGEAPHWHVTFTVADRDAAAASVQRLGGTVVSSDDGQWSRTAVVRDPAGAEFTVSQFTPPS